RAEDDSAAIPGPVRVDGGAAVPRDLPPVLAVGIDDPDLRVASAIGHERDASPVWRPSRRLVRSGARGELRYVRAVTVHDVQLGRPATAVRIEDEPPRIRRPGRFLRNLRSQPEHLVRRDERRRGEEQEGQHGRITPTVWEHSTASWTRTVASLGNSTGVRSGGYIGGTTPPFPILRRPGTTDPSR